jgi:membrane-anchored protein YejM (alkaline phosphatase superfamily)
MYKLITILIALVPIILFVKTVFFGRSQVMKQASAELRRQIDYLVWAILFLIACGIVYSTINLIHPIWK